jgi:HAMP domain-containing protein
MAGLAGNGMSDATSETRRLADYLGGLSPLSVSHKLTLAFVLFLAPLGYVTAKLTEQQQKAIDFADKERRGLRYLALVGEAEAQLFEHVQENAAASGHNHVENARARLLEANAQFGDVLEVDAFAASALAALDAVKAETYPGQAVMAAAQVELAALRREVGDRSNLILDPGLDSYHTMDVVLMKVPALLDSLQALGKTARSAVADGHVSAAERARILAARGFAEDALDQIDTSIAAGIRGASDDRLRDAIGRFQGTARSYVQEMIDEVALATSRPRASSAGMNGAESTARLSVSSLASAMRLELDRLLRERIERFENERLYTLLVAAALFLAALSMTVLFVRRGVLQPLGMLTDSIRTLSAGEYDDAVPLQTRGDEIGEIARAVEVLRDMARSKLNSDAARAAAELADWTVGLVHGTVSGRVSRGRRTRSY